MNHYYQSIKISGEILKLNSVFEENKLNLTIFQAESSWNVKVSKEELEACAKEHSAKFNEYYDNLKKYLGSTLTNIEFDFKDGGFSIYLLLRNKMKMLYFHCRLDKIDFSNCIYSLVDELFNKNVQYFNELHETRDQYSSVRKEFKVISEKMDEFLIRKQMDEYNLCNNFTALLNEKKRQIQHLNDLLNEFRQNKSAFSSLPQKKRKRPIMAKNNKKNKNVFESSADESNNASGNENYDTNDSMSNDSDPSTTTNVYQKQDFSLPSTSKILSEPDYKLLSDEPTEPFIFSKRIRNDKHAKLHNNEIKEESNIVETFSNQSNINPILSATVNYNTQDILDNID